MQCLDMRPIVERVQTEQRNAVLPSKIDNRVSRAENDVYECLNYGGIFHDGVPTNKDLEFAYDKGDLSGEVSRMRALAVAISELADALEDEGKKDESPFRASKSGIPQKSNKTERENILCVLLFIFVGVLIMMLMIGSR